FSTTASVNIPSVVATRRALPECPFPCTPSGCTSANSTNVPICPVPKAPSGFTSVLNPSRIPACPIPKRPREFDSTNALVERSPTPEVVAVPNDVGEAYSLDNGRFDKGLNPSIYFDLLLH